MWQHCANMAIPDTLQYKIDHFKHFGRLIPGEMDLFGNASWLAVHIGQMNWPERNDPLIDYRTLNGTDYIEQMRSTMALAAQGLPTHRGYINRHCKAM
jgi:tryptophan halogenase